MPKPSSFHLAKSQIASYFSQSTQKLYSQTQLANLLREHRLSWKIASHAKIDDFIVFLTKHCDLQTHELRSDTYDQEITRYSWGRASPYEVALSTKAQAYLCHATALQLHNLATPASKTIYLNSEQSPKPPPFGQLTQGGIDRAFAREQRKSNLVYSYAAASIVIISGKNTKRLGVEERIGPSSEILTVTNLERTLVDIVVRPTYAGGVSNVLSAYCAAKEHVSVEKLLTMLQALDYVYPYHQAIGFLMQQAGHSQNEYEKMRSLGLNHDFHLDHCMQQPKYSKEWRLYYPKSFTK